MSNADNPFLKKPCANCPFLKEGAIRLQRGRLRGIADSLERDDHAGFPCHKTVHHKKGGEWDDEGNYQPSGNEKMCAGAAAWLMKQRMPNVAMRMAIVTGLVPKEYWDDAKAVTVDTITNNTSTE